MNWIVKRAPAIVLSDISALGSMVFYALVMAIVALHDLSVASRLLVGLVMIVVITVAVRLVYFKHRPKRMLYNSFLERIDASSFPSLHSARIMFMALILHSVFDSIGADILLVVIVIMVCYSRHYLQKHYLSDILAGVLLGAIVFTAVNALL